MDKAPDAYRTISEVADDLDLPQHVLRFWETRFTQIKPLKRGGGRRYYRPDDVELLKGIRHLLYGEGFTIRGVQRILKDQGVKAVALHGREGGHPAPALLKEPGAEHAPPDMGKAPVAIAPVPASLTPLQKVPSFQPFLATSREVEPTPPRIQLEALPAAVEARVIPRENHDRYEEVVPRITVSDRIHAPVQQARATVSALAQPQESGLSLSREDIRRLQAILYELSECRQLLDAALAAKPKSA